MSSHPPKDLSPAHPAGQPFRRPELLAPAGDWECLRAAVANGADAVYFGLTRFSARQRAANFTLEDLPHVLEHLHATNVKGYVAFNTLAFSDELEQAAECIAAAATAGADAVIVQDLGLAALARRMAPSLPIHASTQATQTEHRGIEALAEMGISRVILARELSLEQVRSVARSTSVELEVFVHGALCISFSGQCLACESLWGRSANRGMCAQACRLPYELVVDGEARPGGPRHLLSPQDLAAHEMIGELVRSGVAGLKIEGRLKAPRYVAAATGTYRAAIDAAVAGRPFSITPRQVQELAQSFSRGFTRGFLGGVDHQTLVQGSSPKPRGLRLGRVTETTERGVVVELEKNLNSPDAVKPGDGVVFASGDPQREQGGRVYAVREMGKKGTGTPKQRASPSPFSPACLSPFSSSRATLVELRFGEGDVDLSAIAAGCAVWKTDDPQLRRQLEVTYSRQEALRRAPLSVRVTGGVGQPLSVTVADASGHSATVQSPQPLQQADKYPLTAELVGQQFGRLGPTPFELGPVELIGPGGPADSLPVMAPKSVLNDLRRQAVEALLVQRAASATHAVAEPAALDALRKHAAEIEPDGGKQGQARPNSGRASPCFPQAGENGDRHAQTAGEPVPIFAPRLYVLARTMEQVGGIAAMAQESRPAMVYCDLTDDGEADAAARLLADVGIAAAMVTPRIFVQGQEEPLARIAAANAAGVLVRNLSAMEFLQERSEGGNRDRHGREKSRDRHAANNAASEKGDRHAQTAGEPVPILTLVGDHSLNAANELAVAALAGLGLRRITAAVDVSWNQFRCMLARLRPEWIEAIIHQHVPMFHTAHCLAAATLTTGRSCHDCGRPCIRHRLALRDRLGVQHPITTDACGHNTIFARRPQSAARHVQAMVELGVRHFRLELLDQSGAEAAELTDAYGQLVSGRQTPAATWQRVESACPFGLTEGTWQHD